LQWQSQNLKVANSDGKSAIVSNQRYFCNFQCSVFYALNRFLRLKYENFFSINKSQQQLQKIGTSNKITEKDNKKV